MFPAGDSVRRERKSQRMAAQHLSEISTVARERFLELMDDMGWGPKWAIDQLYKEIGQPLRINRKTIEQWFNPKRAGIPPGHIFNISDAFGVDAGWLAGQLHIEKRQAIRSGIYVREIERERARHTLKRHA